MDGKAYAFKMSFGSSATTYDANYAMEKNLIQKRQNPVTTALVDATTVNAEASETEKYVQLTLSEATSTAQDFLLVDDSIMRALDATVDKMVIRIYNASSETVSGQMMIKYGKNLKTYAGYGSIDLKPGMNMISINNFAGFRWNDIKYIHSLRISVGEKGDAMRNGLYFVDMTVYKK